MSPPKQETKPRLPIKKPFRGAGQSGLRGTKTRNLLERGFLQATVGSMHRTLLCLQTIGTPQKSRCIYLLRRSFRYRSRLWLGILLNGRRPVVRLGFESTRALHATMLPKGLRHVGIPYCRVRRVASHNRILVNTQPAANEDHGAVDLSVAGLPMRSMRVCHSTDLGDMAPVAGGGLRR